MTCKSGLSSGFFSCICSSSFWISSPSSTPSSGSATKLNAAESVEPREKTWPCVAQREVGWRTRAGHTAVWRRLMQSGRVLLKRSERISTDVESASHFWDFFYGFSLLSTLWNNGQQWFFFFCLFFSNRMLVGLMNCAKPTFKNQQPRPVLMW